MAIRQPTSTRALLACVRIGAEEMQRYVRSIADDPAVMSDGWNVKQRPLMQFDDTPVFELDGGRS